jgi:hypothetical protein
MEGPGKELVNVLEAAWHTIRHRWNADGDVLADADGELTSPPSGPAQHSRAQHDPEDQVHVT